MPSLSPEKRARILVLLEEKYPAREIARREGVHHSTVTNIRKRWQQTQSYQDAHRMGRPRVASERGERRIAQLVTSGQCRTAADAQQLLREWEKQPSPPRPYAVSSSAAVWWLESSGGSPSSWKDTVKRDSASPKSMRGGGPPIGGA